MKVAIKILVASVLLLVNYHDMLGNSHADLSFIKKYEVDPEVKAILDAHHEEISHRLNKITHQGITEHQAWTFPWLPGYFVKFNLDRIRGMERMKRVIEHHHLDLIEVPDKRIYHVKGRPETLNNMNYVVVVKAVVADPHAEPMTLRHVQQMETLMRETHYISTTATNYIRTFNGKLVMIDTESTFDRTKLLSKGFMRLISAYHDINKDYTQEALRYILTQMASLLSHHRGSERAALIKQIKMHLKKPKKPAWDYLGHFESSVRRLV